MKAALLCMLAVPVVACAQNTAPYAYSGGVLAAPAWVEGYVTVPKDKQFDRERITQTVDGAGQYRYRDQFLYAAPGFTGFAYDRISYGENKSAGGMSLDYVRVHGTGTGVAIARKTAVRGHADQWGVWGEQFALGPGTKAAMWVAGEDAAVVPNVLVVTDLNVSGAVLQYNAQSAATGVFFRVYKDGKVTAELTADGVLRVKRVELLP
jgi:hypothetical protein